MASLTKNPEGAEPKKAEKKQAPKRGIKNPFVYGGTVVILVITIVAFVFIPSMGGSLRSNSAPEFGTWKGTPITYTAGSYFATQVAQINDYLKKQGLSEQNFQLYAYQVWRMAFQSTAVRTAMIQSVRSAGFAVTEKGLDEAITQHAAFQEDGKFSLQKYNSTPLSSKMSIREEVAQESLLRRYYEDLYTQTPSSAEASFIASIAKPQRDIDYISIALSAFPDSEVQKWAAQNPDNFRSLGISRITITSSEADAKKILQQVKDNKLSFEDAAKSHSQDSYAAKGGDAGSVFYHVFAADFSSKDDAAKVAALGKGELSSVYKVSDKAWIFYRIDAPLSQPDFTKPATLAEVKAYLNASERGVLESWAIAKANEVVSSTDAALFRGSAKKLKLDVKSAGPFIINIGNPTFYAYNQQIPLLQSTWQSQDPAISGAEKDEAFMTTLFSTPKGKVSKPLVLGDNVIVFAVTKDAPAVEDDLALIKMAFPYFHQQSLETEARNTFLASKSLKDEFNTAFFRIYGNNTSTTKATETTTTVAQAPAK
jgi:hypothetical protein